MHRLDPAGLLRFRLDALLAYQVEQGRRAVAQQRDEALARFPVASEDVVRVGARQGRDHLAVVAPRGAPAGFHGLQHRDADAGAPQVQGGGEASEAGADHHGVRRVRTLQLRQRRTGWRDGGPQRGRPGDVWRSHGPRTSPTFGVSASLM
jgi:hypothetical protein